MKAKETETPPARARKEIEMDYLHRIRTARTREECALAIRAMGCHFVAGPGGATLPLNQRIEVLEQYNRHAEQVERDFEDERGEIVGDSHHPYRRWLIEWGYC